MFICDVCGKVTKEGEKSHMIVAQRRFVTYPYRPGANRIKNQETLKYDFIPDTGGEGWQIVKELRACGDCKSYSPELDNH